MFVYKDKNTEQKLHSSRDENLKIHRKKRICNESCIGFITDAKVEDYKQFHHAPPQKQNYFECFFSPSPQLML